MYLHVTSDRSAIVGDPEDCTALSVRIDDRLISEAQLHEAMQGIGVTYSDNEIGLLANELRRRARVALGPAWEPAWDDRFDAMINYARTRGWYDPTTGTVTAHIEIAPDTA